MDGMGGCDDICVVDDDCPYDAKVPMDEDGSTLVDLTDCPYDSDSMELSLMVVNDVVVIDEDTSDDKYESVSDCMMNGCGFMLIVML